MTNFNHKATLDFWKNYKDPIVYRVVTLMESLEDWTIDDNKNLEKALQALGNSMDGIGSTEIIQKEELIKVAAFIKISRMLYILQVLDTAHPGTASKLLTFAENTSPSSQEANLFLQRNVTFERLRLLSRVFSKKRLALVQQALEEENID